MNDKDGAGKSAGTRRDFLKRLSLGAGAAAMGCAPLASMRTGRGGVPHGDRRPDILVIHVDQLRFDCLGACGNPDLKTPHIDRLAREGVTFKNSFCPFPVCTPSRYSLLSGLYVHDHKGWSNRSTLHPAIDTFPRILRAAGYRTKAVGKMHFTPTYLDVGFSELLLAEQDGPGRWDDDYHRYLMARGLVDRNDLEDQRREYRDRAPEAYWKAFGAMVSNLEEKHHSTTWIAERAVEALETWDEDGGHLLMAGFIKPHHPFDPPAPWHGMYDPKTLDLLPGWTGRCPEHDLSYGRGYFPNDTLNEPALRRIMAYYYATISQIDHHVGRMIACLERKGLYDNALVVFTADHGEYLGFHHMLLKGNYMYDPLAKVPLIIKWPGGARGGTTSERLVNNIDLAPTLCRAAGCRPGDRMIGLDLREEGKDRELVFAEARGGGQVMARSHTGKLILSSFQGKEQKYFHDMKKDPMEMRNAYKEAAHRHEISAMEAELASWRHAGPAEPYVDHAAPLIRQANVPPSDLSHREAVIAYCREKMEALEEREQGD